MGSVNILVCGLYFSGSGAVTDLLKEYEGICNIPGEFDDFRRAGLVGDHLAGHVSQDYPSQIKVLTKNLMNSSALYSKVGPKRAIENRIKYNLIKYGFGFLSGQESKPIKRLFLLERLEYRLTGSISDIGLAVDWISDLKKVYSSTSDFFVFDQPIFLGQHRDLWPKVFDPFKLIVIFRDPRDQIAEILRNNNIYKDMLTPTQGIFEKYGTGRLAAIKYNADLIVSRAKNALSLRRDLGSESVLFLRFEDLVKDVSNARKEIENFLGLSASSLSREHEFFDPSISIKNVGIYKKTLTREQCSVVTDCLQFMNEELAFEEKYVG